MGSGIEILAPAGSVETMRAALNGGADAVYIGGSRFGARAYADNPDETALLAAIDEVHLRGKKLYMAVNTLLKEREMDELYHFILPYYREGLDGVIVQDFGVLARLKSWFPSLPLHASTQMTLTGWEEAARLKADGVSRIVPSRELSLEEIRQIHERVDVEIEAFVHGALCYCYSGQCLLSSFIGGRSGNRGRCAQPCRLPYKVGKDQKTRYLLSPKDICTLKDIPDLVDAGIISFKIEGRMKKPEYAALVSFMYRFYTDMYLERGREGYRVDPDDVRKLMDLYNRGGFSGGYYRQKNGKDMLSLDRPNHMGVKVGESVGKNRFKALEDIHADDVLEWTGDDRSKGMRLDRDIRKGELFAFPKAGMAGKGKGELYRTRNNQLITDTLKRFAKGGEHLLEGSLTATAGKPLCLRIGSKDRSDRQIQVTGRVVQEAVKRPVGSEEMEKQMRKTGGSGFCFQTIQIQTDGKSFVPVQELNSLRREGLDRMRECLLEVYKRDDARDEHGDIWLSGSADGRKEDERQREAANGSRPLLYVSIPNVESGMVHMKRRDVSGFYLDIEHAATPEGQAFIRACGEMGKTVAAALPHILREKDKAKVEEWIRSLDGLVHGWLFRNMETLDMLKRLAVSGIRIADHHIYTMNRAAKEYVRQAGADRLCAPMELNQKELDILGCGDMELVLYGYPVLMLSAQCIQKTTQACTKRTKMVQLTDRQQKHFYAQNICTYCYNLIYNGSPLVLTDMTEAVRDLDPEAVRMEFTMEDIREQTRLLDDFRLRCQGEGKADPPVDPFTRGHFKRGIE